MRVILLVDTLFLSKGCNICPYSPRKAPDKVTPGLKLKGKKQPPGEDLCREGEEKAGVLRRDQTCERRACGRGCREVGREEKHMKGICEREWIKGRCLCYRSIFKASNSARHTGCAR